MWTPLGNSWWCRHGFGYQCCLRSSEKCWIPPSQWWLNSASANLWQIISKQYSDHQSGKKFCDKVIVCTTISAKNRWLSTQNREWHSFEKSFERLRCIHLKIGISVFQDLFWLKVHFTKLGEKLIKAIWSKFFLSILNPWSGLISESVCLFVCLSGALNESGKDAVNRLTAEPWAAWI